MTANLPTPTIRYVEANGQTFAVDEMGDGDTLALCLHGFPESRHSWRAQLPLLAKLGYTAWAPDLRGYGDTTRPKGVKNYLIDTLCDDVAALIDASGKSKVVLIAHDWGGAIAWSFVMQQLRPLDKFIVMNLPHPQKMQERMKQGSKQLFRSWYIFFFQIPWLPEFMMKLGKARFIRQAFLGMAIDKRRFPKEVLDHYADNARKPGALTAMVNYYRGLIRGGGSERMKDKQIDIIDVPTLMIWGEEDTALDISTTYNTDELVSDFTIRYVPNVSHWVQQEAPEVVNAIMEAWLTGQPVPEAITLDPRLESRDRVESEPYREPA
ncbi:MAG: alpha/beta hydrolase [Alphaproteobacteria bacterium]